MRKREKKIEDWENEFLKLIGDRNFCLSDPENGYRLLSFIRQLLKEVRQQERERTLSRVKSEIQKHAGYMDKETLIKVIENKVKND